MCILSLDNYFSDFTFLYCTVVQHDKRIMGHSSYRYRSVPTKENNSFLPSVVCRRVNQASMNTNYYDREGDHGSSLHHDPLIKHSNNLFQARVYNFLERPCGTFCFLYHFTVFIIVISSLIYSSILTVCTERSQSILFWMEFTLFISFLIEFLIRVWSSGCRSKYRGRRGRLLFVRKAMCIVDLCVLVGYAILLCMGIMNTQFSIQLIRYLRILQILRFLHVDRRLTSCRLLGSVIYDHRYELTATLYFCFIFLIAVAYLIWLVEKDENKSSSEDMFHSFADTLWWTIITMVS